MCLRSRCLAFIMCHAGFFATVFLLALAQPGPDQTDTAALSDPARPGTMVLAGGLN